MIRLREEHRLIKSLVYRVIRRHIAGSTLKSALEEVGKLNVSGASATLTFLNETVPDTLKAKYNSNTYVHMIKQLSRLHMNCSVSARLSQLGFGVSEECADRCLSGMLDAAAKSSVRVWIEAGRGVGQDKLIEVYEKHIEDSDILGIEVSVNNMRYMKKLGGIIKKGAPVRLTRNPYFFSDLQSEKKNMKECLDSYAASIKELSQSKAEICIQESDDKLVSKVSGMIKRNRRDLIFGIPFGYSFKKINKLLKMKMKVDVYVPYGQDWIPYAIYGLAGNRFRRIAMAVLDREKQV